MFQKVVTESDFLMTTPAEAKKLTLEHEEEFIADYQKNANQLLLIADVDGVICGTLSITQAKPKKQSHVGEFGIVVQQQYWNLGIARRMMNAMLQWGKPIRLFTISTSM
jgi:RimJ/RimL family protein N-acetyltransferase